MRWGIAVGNTTNPETQYSGEVTVRVGEDYHYSNELTFMATTFGQALSNQKLSVIKIRIPVMRNLLALT